MPVCPNYFSVEPHLFFVYILVYHKALLLSVVKKPCSLLKKQLDKCELLLRFICFLWWYKYENPKIKINMNFSNRTMSPIWWLVLSTQTAASFTVNNQSSLLPTLSIFCLYYESSTVLTAKKIKESTTAKKLHVVCLWLTKKVIAQKCCQWKENMIFSLLFFSSHIYLFSVSDYDRKLILIMERVNQ